MSDDILDVVDVRFVKFVGHDLLHVWKMVLQMPDVDVLPSLATSDYRTLFSHYIYLTVPHARPHDMFIVTVDGFWMAEVNAGHLYYSALPSDPDTLLLPFRVPRSFI